MTGGRPDRMLAWASDGEELFAAAVAAVEDWSGPSRCPGWDRRTLLAHVARNADALGHLLVWARTGVPTPMYASEAAREAGIAQTAARPVAEIRADHAAAAARLRAACEELPEAAWAAEVHTASGRTVPAATIPWMRCREVWVHATDLAVGPPFTGVPEAVLAALVDDVFTMWERRGESPDLAVAADDADVRRGADGAATTVRAPLGDLVAWLTGRGPAPAGGAALTLPSWL